MNKKGIVSVTCMSDGTCNAGIFITCKCTGSE